MVYAKFTSTVITKHLHHQTSPHQTSPHLDDPAAVGVGGEGKDLSPEGLDYELEAGRLHLQETVYTVV